MIEEESVAVEGAEAAPDQNRRCLSRRALHGIGAIARLNLIRGFGIYTVGNVLGMALPFLLLPILTRFLTPHDYGIVAIFQVLTGISAVLTGLSVQGAVGRQYFERDAESFPVYVASCIFILLCSVTLLSCVIYATAEKIMVITGFPARWLWSVVLFSACQFIISIALVIWQVRGRAAAYSAFNLALVATDVLLSLALVIPAEMAWKGRVLGQVVAHVIFAMVALAMLVRGNWIRPRIDSRYIGSALRFGLPLIPHTMGMWAITMIGRWLVAREEGLAAAGVFVVGAQIGMIVGVLQDSFNRAWVPWFYGELNNGTEESRLRIVKLTYSYNVIILLVALVLSLAAPWIVSLVAPESYAAAVTVVPWIAFGYAFNGMYKMVTNYAFYLRKTHLVAVGTILAGITNLGLGYYLVRINGMVGAAQATAIAFLLSYAYTAVVASRIYPMPSIWHAGVR